MNYLNKLNIGLLSVLLIFCFIAHANNNDKIASLKATVQQAKIFPDSVKADKDFFGGSVSIDGNRALVGVAKLTGIGEVYVFEYNGFNWVESAIIVPNGIRTSDKFGQSVSLKGNVALIGASSDSSNVTLAGAAYIFELDTGIWTQKQKIYPTTPLEKQHFGWSVSLVSDFALMGSRHEFSVTEPGAAFMFKYDILNDLWTQKIKLTATDGFVGNSFGSAVSLSNSRLIIGASNDNQNGSGSGSAYIYSYTYSSTVFQSKISANDGQSSDFFGIAVSIDENRALVGSRNDDNNGLSNSGSAYVFDFDGSNWNQTTKLTATDESASDYFGASVSLKGDKALVGAFGAPSINFVNSGAAYLFEFVTGSWSEINKFNASDDSANDNFGNAVALGANNFIVGNWTDDDNGNDAGAAYIFDDSSGSWQQQQKLLSSLGSKFDQFGYAVSVDGTRALIGAYLNDDMAPDSGSVYVFDYVNGAWALTQQLYADDAQEGDWFGKSVSLFGDRLIVGATHEDTENSNSGAVYVFELSTGIWSQTHKVTVSTTELSDQLGESVSLGNNRLVVGVPGRDLLGFNEGAAYVFEYSNGSWNLIDKLIAADAEESDGFGNSVSLDGNRIVVGSPRGEVGTTSGSAYIFDFQNGSWTQSAKLIASDASGINFFGNSVSLSNNTVLIGAFGDNSNTGASYVFDYDSNNSNWLQTTKLLASDAQAYDSFGMSVALDNNILLVGAFKNDDNGNNSGSTYVYQRINNIWQQTDNLLANDATQGDFFGQAVSLSSELALIGSPNADAHGKDSGASYVFDVDILPVAVDDDVTMVEDTFIVINVLLNDTDPDGGNNQVVSASDPVNGNVSINSPEITYAPLGNYCNDGVTTDDFTYTLNGGATATVRVTVTCADEIAVAVDDTFSINEDVTTNLTVLNNDYDVDSDNNTITILSVTQANNGTVINNTTSISYQPDAEYCNDGNVTDDFTYTLVGGWQATVAMTVNCVDDLAVAVLDTESINEDGNIIIDVLANDTDIDGGIAFVVTSFSQPQFGTVSNSSGDLLYTPSADYCNDGANVDDFSYSITGNSTTTVNVTVYCVNDQPSFSHLGDITTNVVQDYVIENWAFNFDFGSTNENYFQQVNNFNIQVVSDSNNIVNSVELANNGQLSFTTTGNIGAALIEVSMQDDGGVNLSGIDTSITQSFTITFDDTIFVNGFENSNKSQILSYLDKIAITSNDLSVPYFDQQTNSVVFKQYEIYLDDKLFSPKTLNSFKLWIDEILRYTFISY